jgi:hypothetical protein
MILRYISSCLVLAFRFSVYGILFAFNRHFSLWWGLYFMACSLLEDESLQRNLVWNTVQSHVLDRWMCSRPKRHAMKTYSGNGAKTALVLNLVTGWRRSSVCFGRTTNRIGGWLDATAARHSGSQTNRVFWDQLTTYFPSIQRGPRRKLKIGRTHTENKVIS